MASYGSMIRVFALFLFIFVLLESFMSHRLMLDDYFMNRSPEYRMRRYVFGHRYQSEIFYRSTIIKF